MAIARTSGFKSTDEGSPQQACALFVDVISAFDWVLRAIAVHSDMSDEAIPDWMARLGFGGPE
eukprot:515585-Heterocapsa_arctica.AAC.1